MKEIRLLMLVSLIQFSVAATIQSYVVSSTETPKEGKEGSSVTSPLLPVIYEMDINANISNRFAKALVVSKVKNTDTSAKEATFTVVLPEKAFISEFVMEIGGKSYKAYVKEKEEAKNIYDKAVASGQSAAHVAVSARDSNRFTVSVNVEPESKAVFYLTYEELLERKNEQYELVLNINPGQVVKKLNVEVYINETRTLKFVKTPSLRSGNEISKNEDKLDPLSDIKIINATSAIVKFTPDSEKQKQFARDLGNKESDGLSGQFVVQYDVERDSQGGEVLLQDGYFVHFFAPKDLEPLPKHVVFVLDISGSMGGRKIEQLKTAMDSILTELRTEDKLHIVVFNSDVNVYDIPSETTTAINYSYEENYQEPFQKLSDKNLPSPTPASQENLLKAKNVIKNIYANGGTHMIGGLETALYLVKREQETNPNSSEKHQPLIVFLTDGDPNVGLYSTEEISKLVTKLNFENNKAPIFSLSFGNGANKDFLRKMSLKNLGFSRHIYEASDASLQLEEFYKQISSPVLSNIQFKYDADVSKVTKTHFPIYFRGSELVVTGKYDVSASKTYPAVVNCWGPRGPIILRPTVEQPVTSLERLWAYLTVKQKLEERDSAENKTELTKKALDLALTYSFVTDVSSLVVVKPNATSAVNTEEASAKNNLQDRIFGGAAFGRGGTVAFSKVAHSRISGQSTFLRFGGGGSPMPRPMMHISSPIVHPVDLIKSTSMGISTSTAKPTLPHALPWLASVLNPNGTLTLSQGTYELGANENSTYAECPKTPINNSTETGMCALLKDCPEVYSLLTDLQLYEQYFCQINNKFAGVCCPKKIKS